MRSLRERRIRRVPTLRSLFLFLYQKKKPQEYVCVHRGLCRDYPRQQNNKKRKKHTRPSQDEAFSKYTPVRHVRCGNAVVSSNLKKKTQGCKIISTGIAKKKKGTKPTHKRIRRGTLMRLLTHQNKSFFYASSTPTPRTLPSAFSRHCCVADEALRFAVGRKTLSVSFRGVSAGQQD